MSNLSHSDKVLLFYAALVVLCELIRFLIDRKNSRDLENTNNKSYKHDSKNKRNFITVIYGLTLLFEIIFLIFLYSRIVCVK